MNPLFEDGFILTLNAEQPFSEEDLLESKLDANTVFLRGDFSNCISLLEKIKHSNCGIHAGVKVRSLQEGVAALNAGAAFICPSYLPIESSEEWNRYGQFVFPACSGEEETVKMMDAGFDTLWLEEEDQNRLMDILRKIHGTAPKVQFICAGRFDPKGIETLTPFYNVRAVCTQVADSVAEAACIAKSAGKAVLGFEFAHLGINTESETEAEQLAKMFAGLFGFQTWDNGNSFYASDRIECMKFRQIGTLGHIAIRSNSVERAKVYLSKLGLTPVESTAKYRDGRLHNIYFSEEFGGFSIHLLQKKPADPS